MIDTELLNKRTQSSFPLSIGTGIALESIFDPTAPRYDEAREFEKYDINKYKYHIYSVYTLLRNIVQSVNVNDKTIVINHQGFIPALRDEITVLSSLYGMTTCKPLLYLPDYDSIYAKYNKNKDVGINRLYGELQDMLGRIGNELTYSEIEVITDSNIPLVLDDEVLITTSLATDLLINKKIKKLSLLESHTGKLINKNHWYKKYHAIGKRLLEVFPFLPELLFILGDNVIVKPLSTKLRIELYELAVSNNWTYKTTKERVIYDISKSIELASWLHSLKKS